jgi:hypothetical protein
MDKLAEEEEQQPELEKVEEQRLVTYFCRKSFNFLAIIVRIKNRF